MEKHIDSYLAKVLKQWVVRQRPPAVGRERLLRQAATPLPPSPNKFALSWLTDQGAFHPDILGMELSRKLTEWMVLPFQPRLGNFSIV
jgi:hypothetical protein